jgi:hypothetical protein
MRTHPTSILVLVFVDEVLVDTLVHELANLGLQPGHAKGGEVLPRVPVEQQHVAHDAVGVARVVLLERQCKVGLQCVEVGVRVHVLQEFVTHVVYAVNGHLPPRHLSCRFSALFYDGRFWG